MNKMETIDLHNLRNGEHFQFMDYVGKKIQSHFSDMSSLNGLLSQFLSALETEHVAMTAIRGSAKTEPLTALNALRVQTWSAIVARVKSAVLSPLADEAESGARIKHVIGRHSYLHKQTINARSSIIRGLIQNLQEPELATHVERINITAWVAELQHQNEQFLDLMAERNSEFAERPDAKVRAVRKEIDAIYLEMVSRLQAAVVLGMAPDGTDTFMAQLNEKIWYNKQALAIRKGRSRKRREANGNVAEGGEV